VKGKNCAEEEVVTEGSCQGRRRSEECGGEKHAAQKSSTAGGAERNGVYGEEEEVRDEDVIWAAISSRKFSTLMWRGTALKCIG